MADCIMLHPNDNVATVIKRTQRGDKLTIVDARMNVVGEITAEEDIPFAHKISLSDLKSGDRIVKYGEVIGKASADIVKGDYVHVHNVISIEGAEKIVGRSAR